MINVLLVALGGALGSVARYLVSGWVQAWAKGASFPFGTLAVNLLGAFVIGVLSELAETRNFFTPEARALVFVGVLGGFTTFSSLANESINLARADQSWHMLLNIGGSVLLGLLAVWLGRLAASVGVSG